MSAIEQMIEQKKSRIRLKKLEDIKFKLNSKDKFTSKNNFIENNIHRNNTKCKRKHNLIKKSMQLSKLCGQ